MSDFEEEFLCEFNHSAASHFVLDNGHGMNPDNLLDYVNFEVRWMCLNVWFVLRSLGL